MWCGEVNGFSTNKMIFQVKWKFSNVFVGKSGILQCSQLCYSIVDSKARRISTLSAVMREAAVMKWYMT